MDILDRLVGHDAWTTRELLIRCRGLSDEQSADLDAALVLILANHIGDLDVLGEAIALARRRMLETSQQQQQQQ